MALSLVMQNDAGSSIPTLTLSTAHGFTGVASTGVATSASNAEAFAYQQIVTPGAVTFPTWTTTSHPSTSVWLGISLALGSS